MDLQPNPLRDDTQVPGVVIDHVAAATGCYVGSPSLAVLPDGRYVASHDFFGPQSGHTVSARSVLFRSEDRGASWQPLAQLEPLFWGKLFMHGGALYLLGTRHEYGDVLLRRSDDGGTTWTTPTTPATGLLREGPYHCAPTQTLVLAGRLWRSVERWTGGVWGNFEALVMSAPADADLLDARNWTFSAALPRLAEFTWLEGAVLLDPHGTVVNMLRTNGGGDDKAALVRVSADGQRLTFDRAADFIDMPGGGVKFTIRHDAATARYWSIASQQTQPAAYRNRLVLTSSPDLRAWSIEAVLHEHPDRVKHAWQYIDWDFDGDDLIYASRTAFDDGLGGAAAAHDANYLTFHRVPNFRHR